MLSQHTHNLERRSLPRSVGVWGLGRPMPFECRFTPELAAIRVVRRALGQWLGAHQPVNVDCVDDLLIACSELCTNAVRSASGADGSVAVRAHARGDAVVLEVEDDGAGFAWPVAHRLQDVPEEDEHGRGLFIVASITDALEVQVAGGRTLVRCTKCHVLDHPAPAQDRELSAKYRRDAAVPAGSFTESRRR